MPRFHNKPPPGPSRCVPNTTSSRIIKPATRRSSGRRRPSLWALLFAGVCAVFIVIRWVTFFELDGELLRIAVDDDGTDEDESGEEEYTREDSGTDVLKDGAGEEQETKKKSKSNKNEEEEVVDAEENEEDLYFQDPKAPVADWDYFPPKPEPRRDPSWARHPTIKDSLASLTEEQCDGVLATIDTSPPPRRVPSHTACEGYEGVFRIHRFDGGGASGTAFFLFALGMMAWADQHNYLPWVHLEDGFTKPIWDPIVHLNVTQPYVEFDAMVGMGIGWARDKDDPKWFLFPGRPRRRRRKLQSRKFVSRGTGVWEHYFLLPTDFVPGDRSCQTKPLVTMNDGLIVPGMHSNAPWAPRSGRYSESPVVLKDELSLEDWHQPQRLRGAQLAERYLRFTPAMERRAHCAFPDSEFSLGIHIRHGDKGIERHLIGTGRFLEFATAFVENGGNAIYVATDSSEVFSTIFNDWPKKVSRHVVRQGSVVGLSSGETAAFDLGVSRHRTNVEALTDILALSKSTFLIHGVSAMTEAVFFLNPTLIDRSVNLDDEDYLEYHPDTFVEQIMMPLANQEAYR